MRKSWFLLLSAAAILMGSCGVQRKSAETISVNNTINNYPVVADLQVGKKVTESVEWTNILFYSPLKIDVTKGNLIAETLDKNGGDCLLEPQFIVEKNGFPPFYSKNRIVVSGFVGTYKNFRNATDADLEALKATQNLPTNVAHKYNSDEVTPTIVVKYEPNVPAAGGPKKHCRHHKDGKKK
ncbi:MAG: hypothetical protein IKP73_09890 [Bacteroidales bacterium]|nr:hypothetical protein [Bacteroidales bacterium]MBR4325821.1 hypothetical protein [Bacteroidales bacterium]